VKAAQAVLITLYDLNPDEFMLMLSVLPKTFQVCSLVLINVDSVTFTSASEVMKYSLIFGSLLQMHRLEAAVPDFDRFVLED